MSRLKLATTEVPRRLLAAEHQTQLLYPAKKNPILLSLAKKPDAYQIEGPHEARMPKQARARKQALKLVAEEMP